VDVIPFEKKSGRTLAENCFASQGFVGFLLGDASILMVRFIRIANVNKNAEIPE